jgi:ABC-type multidrug transport system fused ATPase/permease subunit
MPLHRKVQERLDGVTLSVRENLSGVRVLRAFCKEEEEMSKFSQKTGALEKVQIFVGKISTLLNPITMVIINLAVIALLQVGAIKVSTGLLTQGMVVALYNYMSQILVELIKMANLIITITKAVACGNRIGAVLELEDIPAVEQGSPSKLLGGIGFQDVSLRYTEGGDASLSHISFHIQAGQTVGIIGGTGSGKTSLVNLITGLYEPTEGNVVLDGIDLSKWNKSVLRKQIGVVPQKAVLFRGTIRENLCWGKEDATDEELWEALDVAQAKNVVLDKSNELDCLVEQGGRNFSGGQRQRLTIARALVRKPQILIMDDSASALDYATDAALRQALRNLCGMTTVIVSQRAASVRHADLILVLDNGELVGQGKHDELMTNCEVYREIYYSQFQREESVDA